MGGIIGVKKLRRKVTNNDNSSERQTSCWDVVYYPMWLVYGLGGRKRYVRDRGMERATMTRGGP